MVWYFKFGVNKGCLGICVDFFAHHFSPFWPFQQHCQSFLKPHSCLQKLAKQIFSHYLFFWSGDKSEALLLGVIYRRMSGDSNQRAVNVNLELELVS